jgi:hypothetical protein
VIAAIKTAVIASSDGVDTAKSSIHRTALNSINVALSTAATTGVMPSFADADQRAAYTLFHLSNRITRVAEFLLFPAFGDSGGGAVARRGWGTATAPKKAAVQGSDQASSSGPAGPVVMQQCEDNNNGGNTACDEWPRSAIARLLYGSSQCEVVSLGGGPAYDAVAVSIVSEFLSIRAGVEQAAAAPAASAVAVPFGAEEDEADREGSATPCTANVTSYVLDYEDGWHSLALAVSAGFASYGGGSDSCSGGGGIGRHKMSMFGMADITVPLAHPSNEVALQRCLSCDIWMANYVVAENAVALRQHGFVFFRDLFKAARPGAVFLFTEVTHRLWPDLVNVAFEAWFVKPVGVKCAPNPGLEEARFLVSFPGLKGRNGGSALYLQKPTCRTPAVPLRMSTRPGGLQSVGAEGGNYAAGLRAALSDVNMQALEVFIMDDARHRHDKIRCKHRGAVEEVEAGDER